MVSLVLREVIGSRSLQPILSFAMARRVPSAGHQHQTREQTLDTRARPAKARICSSEPPCLRWNMRRRRTRHSATRQKQQLGNWTKNSPAANSNLLGSGTSMGQIGPLHQISIAVPRQAFPSFLFPVERMKRDPALRYGGASCRHVRPSLAACCAPRDSSMTRREASETSKDTFPIPPFLPELLVARNFSFRSPDRAGRLAAAKVLLLCTARGNRVRDSYVCSVPHPFPCSTAPPKHIALSCLEPA